MFGEIPDEWDPTSENTPTRRFAEQGLGYDQDNKVNSYSEATLLPLGPQRSVKSFRNLTGGDESVMNLEAPQATFAEHNSRDISENVDSLCSTL